MVLIDVLLPARFDNYSELTHAAREPPGRRLDRTRLLGYSTTVSLGREHACAAHCLDLLLGQLGELLGLDDERLLGQLALAEHLEDALVRVRVRVRPSPLKTPWAKEGGGG